MDQTLDSGFRPGMGGVVPDRFFWAMPPPEEGADGLIEGEPMIDEPEATDATGKPSPRRVH